MDGHIFQDLVKIFGFLFVRLGNLLCFQLTIPGKRFSGDFAVAAREGHVRFLEGVYSATLRVDFLDRLSSDLYGYKGLQFLPNRSLIEQVYILSFVVEFT